MFLMLDNLSATLIGIAVLFILVVMQQRVQRVSREQVMMYAANQHIIDFGAWIEEDMNNIGWGVSGSNGVTGIMQNDTIPDLTRLFSFDRFLDSTSVVTSSVQYQVVPALDGSGAQRFAEINGTDVPLWQVQRLVAGVVTGDSAPFITHFNIELENNLGQPVAANAAEQVSIQIAMGMPFGEDAHIPETHWGTTFGLLSSN